MHGYGLLQPRTESYPGHANYSRSAESSQAILGGLLHPRRVNIYQDLWQRSYMAKAFTMSTPSRTAWSSRAENTLLSHDLFEGIHARVGLVTDIAVVLRLSPSYLTYMAGSAAGRAGDWQLLPFIAGPPAARARYRTAANHGRPSV